jgi:hypothetical protein
MSAEVKEIQMDMPAEGRRSRKRGAGGHKGRKTRVADTDENASTVVTKDEHKPTPTSTVVPKAVAVPTAQPPVASQQSVQSPKVVIAPAKKKPAKIMLVPKGKAVVRTVPRKTFKAKSVKVTIDNTAKTQKHRKSVLAKVDTMTDDQIRAASVQARLSRRETVSKAPIGLLRQMVKDYQTMRGMLL